jgi:hypothetical protein
MNAQVVEQPVAQLPAVAQPQRERAMQRVGNQFLPQSFGELIRYSEYIAESDMVPKDYRGKPANVAIAVQWGMELGLSPLQAIQNIAVINGRPSLWGDLVVALIQSHPDYLDMSDMDMRDDKGNPVGCRVTLKRKGRTPVTREFRKEDAEKAGLWGKSGPWQTATARMLMIRARTFAIRDLFADALRGIAVREEMEDAINLDSGDYSRVETVKTAIEMPKAKSLPATDPELLAKQVADAAADPTSPDQDSPPETQARGIFVTDSQKKLLLAKAKSAGLTEQELIAKFNRVDAKNLNDVLADLRKVAEAQ